MSLPDDMSVLITFGRFQYDVFEPLDTFVCNWDLDPDIQNVRLRVGPGPCVYMYV